jgi:hypothetical protein
MSGTSQNRSIELLPFGPLFIGYTSSTLGKRKKKDGRSCVHFELSHWLHENFIS